MFGVVGCIICLCIYAIFIIIGFFLNKKLNNINADDTKSGVVAGKIVDIIFNKYGLEPIKNNETENIEETEENNKNINTEEKPRFQFDTTKDEVHLPEETDYIKDEFECVERIEGKLNSYDINYEDRKIMLSDDLCDSSTTTSVGIAAYQSISLISEFQEKTLRDSFISFITCVPKIIIQIGWLLCVIPVLGVMNVSNGVSAVIAISIFVSFLLNLLRIIKPKENAEIAVEELIEEKIINEDEVETVYDVTNALAYKEVTSCFGLLRWFLRKYMGYNV